MTVLLLTFREEPALPGTTPVKADCNEVWTGAFSHDSNQFLAAGDTDSGVPNSQSIEHVSVFDVAKRQMLAQLSHEARRHDQEHGCGRSWNKTDHRRYDGFVREYPMDVGGGMLAATSYSVADGQGG